MTVTAFGVPGLTFGPLVLACPLWALILLHAWQIIGQGRRNAWFALSIEAGLLLLTTPAAIGLLLLLVAFALATARGRRTLTSFDPLFALLVVVVLALPYLIWLVRADALDMPQWPAVAELNLRLLRGGELLGGLLLAMAGIALLVILEAQHVQVVRGAEFFEQDASGAGAGVRRVEQGQVHGVLVMAVNRKHRRACCRRLGKTRARMTE